MQAALHECDTQTSSCQGNAGRHKREAAQILMVQGWSSVSRSQWSHDSSGSPCWLPYTLLLRSVELKQLILTAGHAYMKKNGNLPGSWQDIRLLKVAVLELEVSHATQ